MSNPTTTDLFGFLLNVNQPKSVLRVLFLFGFGLLFNQFAVKAEVEQPLVKRKIQVLLDSADYYAKINSKLQLRVANELRKLVKPSETNDEIVFTYLSLGRGNVLFGNLDSARVFLLTAEKFMKPSTSLRVKAKFYQNYGIYFSRLSNFKKGIELTQKAYNIYFELNDSLAMASSLGNIGTFYRNMELYSKALEYFNESSAIFEKLKDNRGLAFNTNNAANIYLYKLEYEKAIPYYLKALELMHKEQLSKEAIVIVQANLLRCYLNTNKIEEATQLYSNYLKEIKANTNNFDLWYLYQVAAEIEMRRKNFKKAIAYADTGYLLVKAKKYIADEIRFLELKKLIYTELKDYEKAIFFAQAIDSTKDTNRDTISQAIFLQLETEFQLKRRNDTIQQLSVLQESQEELAKIQKNIIYLVVGLLLLLLIAFGLIYINFTKAKAAEKVLAERNKEIEEKNKELYSQNEFQLMVMGIIGHDLRGPIGSLATLAPYYLEMLESGDYAEAEKHTKLIFKSLHSMYALADNLVQWAYSVQTGLNLSIGQVVVAPLLNNMPVLFNDLLNTKELQLEIISHPSHFCLADANCLNTIVRNLLSNAIKFSNPGDTISIISEDKGSTLSIKIIDRGIGISEEILARMFTSQHKSMAVGTGGEKGSGFGLLMVNSLVRLNNGSLTVQSKEGEGSVFEVELPKPNTGYKISI